MACFAVNIHLPAMTTPTPPITLAAEPLPELHHAASPAADQPVRLPRWLNTATRVKNEYLQTKAPELGFGALSIVLRLFCLLPFLTGSADLILGAKFLQGGGANLSDQVITDPVLNSQIHFWGAIWIGYGVALWWVSLHLWSEAVMFRILMGTLFFCGLARCLSVLLYGWPGQLLTGAIALEIFGSAALWLWHQWLLRKI